MNIFRLIASDLKANRRNPKGAFICVNYRIAHQCVGAPFLLKPLAYAWILVYKAVSEYIVGTEIHWRAKIGPFLTVYHAYGLVVNSNAVIGANCVLRHGVTIGVKETNESLASPILGDRVDVGAGAILIGGISVGDDAIIGAGSVVVKDVPRGAVVAGNPARIIRMPTID